ncbi:MAG: hypothetical protein J6Z34_03375 [Clostridia bacterium]|nr:hypothetical protein [Clostridia bacterium]
MRRDAREAVYRRLYSYFLTGEADGETKDYFYKEHKLTEKDVAFADSLFFAVFENEKSTVEEINDLTATYGADRLTHLD